MLTEARIEAELRPVEGLEWITALRSVQLQELVADGALQLSLFDHIDLAEIIHPDYPGERLVVCRNLLLAQERVRKRCRSSSCTAIGTGRWSTKTSLRGAPG